MHLYIIRHFNSSYNIEGLTKNGYKESKELATKLKENEVNKIYCLNMIRAKLTAKPTSKLLNLDIYIHKWLIKLEELQ